jgi:hypothetical protein
MRGLVTSIHLPLSVTNMKYLPKEYQEMVEEMFKVFGRVDQMQTFKGRAALNNDIWWNVLGWIHAWEIPIVGGGLCNHF